MTQIHWRNRSSTQVVWDDVLVDKTVQSLLAMNDSHIPLYNGKNWREWDRRLQNLLRPFDGVLDILMGKATGDKGGYSAKIDEVLLAIIDRKVDSNLYFLMLNLGEGGKGASAYENLEEHYMMVHAPCVKSMVSDKVDKLKQEVDEAFADYAVRALQLQEQAYDADVFQAKGAAHCFIKIFFGGIETGEKTNSKAGYLMHECGNDLTKLVGALQGVRL